MGFKKDTGIYHWKKDLLEEILLSKTDSQGSGRGTDRQSRKWQGDRQTVKEVAGTLQRGQAVVVPDKDQKPLFLIIIHDHWLNCKTDILFPVLGFLLSYSISIEWRLAHQTSNMSSVSLIFRTLYLSAKT